MKIIALSITAGEITKVQYRYHRIAYSVHTVGILWDEVL